MVTGMFRSGTTLLARMLHANPNIICASDPYAPIFKSYRNNHIKNIGLDLCADAPLHDYYFDVEQQKLFDEIKNSDFDLAFDIVSITELRRKIKVHCKPYSPMIHNFIELLDGSSYAEIFRSGLKVIEKSYGKSDCNVIGFIDVWVGEFAQHFLKLGNNAKVIHLVRDPRSVIASNFASGSRYPLLFLARQWRKLASIAWLDNSNSDRVKLIRFEDLLASPTEVAKDICSFLEVNYSGDMVDPQKYKDGQGRPWHQNTSYKSNESDNGGRVFNLTAINKWNRTLSNETLGLIGKLCAPEMELLGYENGLNSNLDPFLNIDYKDNLSFLADWIRPYSNYNNFNEIATESARYRLLNSDTKISDKVKKSLALDVDVYDKLVSMSRN